jgi:predicted exporter
MGAVQHAVWGASSARQEVSTIGNGSLLGIVVLILLVFGMNRSLVIALLPLGAGIAGGLIVTLFCFGHVHLITLVFGSSVIGVAMDYSLHYLTEHYKTTHPEEVLSKILPGITLAMVTSLIAYAAIGFAPFPVLRQVALFSCAGLFMSWMTVISLFPHTLPPAHFTAPRYLRWSGKLDTHLQQLFDRPFSRITLLLFALAMLPGVLTLRADDDLRLLQAPEAGISAMEKTVRSLTGIDPGGRFFLIEGNTIEQLLQRSEALKEAGLEAFGTPIETLATYLPSQRRQKQNFALQQHLHAHMALDWQQQLGLASSVMEQAAAPLQEAPAQWLDATQFLASPAAFQAARFQLTATDRGWIAVGFVPDKTDFSAMRELAAEFAGVHWMDPVDDISKLFQEYRQKTSELMLFAYSAIAFLLCWRYRPAQAFRVLLSPALAAWITLGILGYAGVAINLFHVLALLLVLGVGIDYSIFFAESRTHRDSTMLAIVLSTITTLLSFGLLSLSETAAIRSFGIVVSLGMVCALLFSPLAQPRRHAIPTHG